MMQVAHHSPVAEPVQSNMLTDLQQDLRHTVCRVLGSVSSAEIGRGAGLGQTPGWDSIKHMELMLVLEEEYDVALSSESVVHMMTFEGICAMVQDGVGGTGTTTGFAEEDFAEALEEVGLAAGDHVFVQSSVATFGQVQNPLPTFQNAFQRVLGADGTLAVPTFNFGFTRGENFDLYETEAETGVFAEHIRTLPGAKRSQHPPFHSVAAIGKHAETLARARGNSSFDRDSVFGKMYDLDFKVCMFGTSLRHNTFFHYVEEQAGVPYRFFKTFTATVTSPAGKETRSYDYFARFPEPAIATDFHGIGEQLLAEFDGRKTTVGNGPIYLFPARAFVDMLSSCLSQSPDFLVAESDKWKVREKAWCRK